MDHQNLFSLGDIPVAPALTREQMILGLLQDAVSDLNKANRALEVSERSNAELRQENFDLWLKAIERDQLAAKLAKCMTEIETLKQALNAATNTPAVPIIDNTSDLEELTDTTSLISTDDASSDVTDIAIDESTDADSAVTMPVITSPVVPTPDFASRLGLCLPPFCRMANARQGLPGLIYDQSGAEVTPESLLAVVKPFTFISLDVVIASYHDVYGCQLTSSRVNPHQFVKTLAKLDGFGCWTPQHLREDSASLAGLTFLWRCDDEPGVARRNILKRLGLADNIMAAIPGPLLCCTLVTLCGMRMDQLTGDILGQIFEAATGTELHSLWVTTKRGNKRMSAIEICTMTKTWVKGLGMLIAMGNGMRRLLDMAERCNNDYARRCGAHDNYTSGKATKEMLDTNENNSRLLLGICKDDLKELCGKLVHVVDSGTSQRTKNRLSEVSRELQPQPCSP